MASIDEDTIDLDTVETTIKETEDDQTAEEDRTTAEPSTFTEEEEDTTTNIDTTKDDEAEEANEMKASKSKIPSTTSQKSKVAMDEDFDITYDSPDEEKYLRDMKTEDISLELDEGPRKSKMEGPQAKVKSMFEVRILFNMFDVDGVGSIPRKDCGTLFRALGTNPSEAEWNAKYDEFAQEESGFIDFPEFYDIYLLFLDSPLTLEETSEAFSVFDKDKKGKLKLKFIKEVVMKLGEPLDSEDFDFMLKRTRLTEEDEITSDDFFAIMSREMGS